MTDQQRTLRQNIRNYLLTASLAQLQVELEISEGRNDAFRAKCVQELIDEQKALPRFLRNPRG